MIRRAGPDNTMEHVVPEKNGKRQIISEVLAGACCFVLIGCSLAAGIFGVKSYLNYSVQANELEVKTRDITIPSVSEAIGSKGVDHLAQELAEMSFRGNEVAALQNRYFKAGEPLTGEAGEKWYQNMQDISGSLSEYFQKNSGATAQWFFVGSEVEEILLWQFEGHYTNPDEGLAAVWTLKDSEGCLVAYAAGGYDVTNQVFTNVDWHVTTYGDELTAAYMDTYDGEDGGESYDEAG